MLHLTEAGHSAPQSSMKHPLKSVPRRPNDVHGESEEPEKAPLAKH